MREYSRFYLNIIHRRPTQLCKALGEEDYEVVLRRVIALRLDGRVPFAWVADGRGRLTP